MTKTTPPGTPAPKPGDGLGKRVRAQQARQRYNHLKKHLTHWSQRPHAPSVYRPWAPTPKRIQYRVGGDGKLHRFELWDLSLMTSSGRPVRKNGAMK